MLLYLREKDSLLPTGGGGSGYIGGVPSFAFRGKTYSPSTQNGVRTGNGYAVITYEAPYVVAEFEKEKILLTDGDRYTLYAEIACAERYVIEKKLASEVSEKVVFNNEEVNDVYINNELVFGFDDR